ncbi:MAG: hypothetical protein NT069_32440 [Planctomycetota bacterium]|nr:hypothetical protein [Planctomycetota bacterium]
MRYTLKQMTTIAGALTAVRNRLKVPNGPLDQVPTETLTTIATALSGAIDRLGRQSCHTYKADQIRNLEMNQAIAALACTRRAIESRKEVAK